MTTPSRFPRSRTSLSLLTWALLAASPGAFAQEESSPSPPPPSEPYVEIVDVEVVNVDVVVTNRGGEQITGLGAEDFVVKVDGERVEISNFYAEADGTAREAVAPVAIPRGPDTEFRPLETVGDPDRRTHVLVLIDHTRLRPSNRKRAFNALREALGRFDDEDVVAVAGLEGSLVVYSDFLFDRGAVTDILDDVQKVSARPRPLEMERRMIFGELTRGMSGGIQARNAGGSRDAASILPRIQAYATQEYERSLESLRSIEAVAATLGGLPGRKVLLYVGEGIPTRPGEGLFVEYRNRFGAAGDTGLGLRHYDFNTNYNKEIGNYDLTQAIDQLALAVNRVGVTLYAVDAEDSHGGSIRSALTEQGATSETVSVVDENFRAPLEAATQATGGRLLRSSGMLAEQLGDVIRDFDTFYSLGFFQPAEWEPGSVHRIEVELAEKRRHTTLRYRTEFRVPKSGEREAAATVAALMYQTIGNTLGIRAAVGSEAPRADGTAALPINLEIPVSALTLVPHGDVHAASVSIYVSVKGEDGNPGPVQRVPFHLNIPADKVAEARQHPAHYVLPLVIRPGDRQAAVLVRDDPSGTMSALRLDLGQSSLGI